MVGEPKTTDAVVNYVGRIPVRNLWLLMLYASDLFRMGGIGSFDLEELPDELPDLIAKLLAKAVEERQRRQLSLGYEHREAPVNRVRGRIDVLTTERRQLLSRGRVACKFEELTVDTIRNRGVRAALETISRYVRGHDLARRCRKLAVDMQRLGVSGSRPTRSQMSAIRFGRHDADDRFMVAAAQLALDLALPTEAAGTNILALPSREEIWVRALFERAVGGFYEVALKPQGWRVACGKKLAWQVEMRTSGIDAIMPGMQTDIMLDHASVGRRIVIDTKFNAIVTTGWHQGETIRSAYIYQMYAYLKSQAGKGDVLADQAEGILIHPSIGRFVDEAVMIQGHSLRFATVDLTGSSSDIRWRLLSLTNPVAFSNRTTGVQLLNAHRLTSASPEVS